MATGPVKPVGTTHWLKGSESEAGMPPASIWHDKVCRTQVSTHVQKPT